MIGWAPASNTTYDYSTADSPATLANGKRVKIESGVRGGNVYEYLGSTTQLPPSGKTTIDLKTQDYGNTDLWKQVNLVEAPAEVLAYLLNSSVNAVGGLNQTAISDQSINALVVAGSAAATGGAVGVSVSGAGAGAVNTITTDVTAFIEGDGATGINAGSVALKAEDTSTISAVTGAASLAAAFGASAGALGLLCLSQPQMALAEGLRNAGAGGMTRRHPPGQAASRTEISRTGNRGSSR
jgi:hypothetical protein